MLWCQGALSHSSTLPTPATDEAAPLFRGNAAAGSLVEEEGPSGEEEEELRDPPPLLRAWLGPAHTLPTPKINFSLATDDTSSCRRLLCPA